MNKTLDCVLVGSCAVDVLVRPVTLESAIGGGRLIEAEPLQLTTGGLVSNSGIAMAKLGMRTAALSYVGDDPWAEVIRQRFAAEGLDSAHLITHPTAATSTTAVLIDSSGERSFAHCVGAPKKLDKEALLSKLDLFSRSRSMLLGYYSLMPNLEKDLPQVFDAIRKTGCQTALDAAGSGGGMEPLDRMLPHLDFYVPSLAEAMHQTGEHDPQAIIEAYRAAGATHMLGVKLGSKGALLSPQPGEWIEIPSVTPPGEVVDTTGAGDSFYAGLLTGLLRGLNAKEAGQLAAAVGACCVTALGASAGLRNYEQTARLAGI